MYLDADVLIIGAGLSGLGLAVQLVRKLGNRNFVLIEKTTIVGGTWHVNSYPGCGCDVPSHFYSYSFAPNAEWSQKFALHPEIHSHLATVAENYDIYPDIRFETEVQSAAWDSETASWLVTLKTKNSEQIHTKDASKGFKGRIFHSACWDHTFDYKDKEVICVGNGCSATQFVPAMSEGPNRVRNITQFSCQPHWPSERPNPSYAEGFKWVMRNVPGAMRLYRLYLFLLLEKDFLGFDIERGAEVRGEWTKSATDYILRNAPQKFRDVLVPNTIVGCKRKVMDTDYLACLHRDNVGLSYNDPIQEIVENGVRHLVPSNT